MKNFTDIKVGDRVICYDEYGHDYIEHELVITGIEYDKEYATDTNPNGMICYGDDVDKEEFGYEHLTVVTESNFCGIKEPRMLIVGGSFDAVCGKPSGLISKMADYLSERYSATVYNGGTLQELREIIYPRISEAKIVLWMPNVSNAEEKLRDVKKINPKAILISSKRNDNERYSFPELISRALEMKANLTIEFAKEDDGKFRMRVFDPLGNLFYRGKDILEMCKCLSDRTDKLVGFTRVPTIAVDEKFAGTSDADESFFSFARGCADVFHNLIAPSNDTKRFLGNLSFRCRNGFPSFRGRDGLVYVSRRNVDKGRISLEHFVPTYLDENNNARYYGEFKPSVDTPVQLRLYKALPQINFMMHAHCYFEGAPFTMHPVPCGAIEEVEEILTAVSKIDKDDDLIAVNLIGHGCILMAKTLDALLSLEDKIDKGFIQRPLPEVFAE